MIYFEVFRRFTKNRIHGIMKETGQIKPEDKENFMNQESQTPHKRRVRYKGKYPKKFEEKYKELQPEKYKDTIEHVDLMLHLVTVGIQRPCWNV